MTDAIKRICQFSPCCKWRYTLWREWHEGELMPNGILGGIYRDRFLMVIGLNPSTADETQDDPTIRRCIGYAKRWGFGALCMTNLFAWRDTDPRKMRAAAEPVGKNNDYWIGQMASNAGMILAAWGAHGTHLGRAAAVRRFIAQPIYCLAINADGSPKHPLYCRADLQPIELK